MEMRDSDPEATHRADLKRSEEALQRMKSKVIAAEYARLLLQEHGQQSSERTLGGSCSQPNQQQHSTFQPYLQPGEQQQSADLTDELDPDSEMIQMENFNSEATHEVDMNTDEVVLHMETEVIDASGQQHSGDSSPGPSAPHGEPQQSTPSSSQPGSSSGECSTPDPSSKSGECPHSASKADELPGSASSVQQQHSVRSEPGPSSQTGQQQHSVHSEPGPSSQTGQQQHSVHSEPGPSSLCAQQQPLPHSSSAGEQQHLDPAAAGGSLPTEEQNPGLSWYCSSFGPTGRPGKWQLDDCFGWQPVPFPMDLLPAWLLQQLQQQSSSSQLNDRRHPVAPSSQLSDRRHPVTSSSQPRDHQVPPLSSKPGDRQRHPVASSSQPDDQRRHPVAHSSPPGDHPLPPSSSRPSAGRPPPCVRPLHWDHLTLDYKPRRRSDSKPGYQQNTVGSNEQQPESSSQPDDDQHPAIAPQPDQQRQDEAPPTSISVPDSEAGQDSVCHPHVPDSQLDQLEGGHEDRA
uniref:Protein piccolo-like n=1 Tax=Elaeis guineensis var. tenera TaxID=51953 RepID=A0A6I9R491_ELAGV|nr:protein piccolo-like [Elaeis guineensis]